MPRISMERIFDDLVAELDPLTFREPVTHVYNPLRYAREPLRQYVSRFGHTFKQVVLVGMNPGPWGMAQTGIPFGDVWFVRDWLGIDAPIGVPQNMHPKRPIHGLACNRREVSGQRLWGWAKERFKTPHFFFNTFWVANYCPLVFMEESGRNRTPDKLPRSEKEPLFEACDRALRRTVEKLRPQSVIGVGNFATQRSQSALSGLGINVVRVTHPSPANPRANQGWSKWMNLTLDSLNISI